MGAEEFFRDLIAQGEVVVVEGVDLEHVVKSALGRRLGLC
jgi:hypothetical protein